MICSETHENLFSCFWWHHFLHFLLIVGHEKHGGPFTCISSIIKMKKIYHISLSSHDEVMFRCEADMIFGFNCLALGVLETDSAILAEGFLSTHVHTLPMTDCPIELFKRFRYAYSRYFNAKYHRRGRLGQKYPFVIEVDGFHHQLTAVNYLNRQGLHHGVAPTPFAYPHCSVNSFFRAALGKPPARELLPDDQRYKYLPGRGPLPSSYRMNSSGLILREDILEVALVESMYATPRNFLYQMNRVGDEIFREDQTKEKSSSPLITLELIEKGTPGMDITQLLRNESGKYNQSNITDIELCELIDQHYLPRCSKAEMIYEASLFERSSMYKCISGELWSKWHKRGTEAQLKRCLIL